MKCLTDEQLLEFIDLECSEKKVMQINDHLKACTQCNNMHSVIKEKTRYIKEKISLLQPVRPFVKNNCRIAAAVFSQPKNPPLLDWLSRKFSVKMPVLAFIALFFIIFSTIIIIQHRQIDRLETTLAAHEKGATLYRVVDNHIKVIALKTKLSAFKPISDPKIYVSKEKVDEI